MAWQGPRRPATAAPCLHSDVRRSSRAAAKSAAACTAQADEGRPLTCERMAQDSCSVLRTEHRAATRREVVVSGGQLSCIRMWLSVRAPSARIRRPFGTVLTAFMAPRVRPPWPATCCQCWRIPARDPPACDDAPTRRCTGDVSSVRSSRGVRHRLGPRSCTGQPTVGLQ